MSDITATKTPTWHERREASRRLFITKMNLLVVGLRTAYFKAEPEIIKEANNKWENDNPDYSLEFPKPVTEGIHHATLETIINTLLAEINEVITKSHAFD